MEFLLMLLAVFGIILLIALIILCVRLNFTLTRVNLLLDDVNEKMKVNMVNDRIVGLITSLIANLVSKFKKKEEEEF